MHNTLQKCRQCAREEFFSLKKKLRANHDISDVLMSAADLLDNLIWETDASAITIRMQK